MWVVDGDVSRVCRTPMARGRKVARGRRALQTLPPQVCPGERYILLFIVTYDKRYYLIASW